MVQLKSLVHRLIPNTPFIVGVLALPLLGTALVPQQARAAVVLSQLDAGTLSTATQSPGNARFDIQFVAAATSARGISFKIHETGAYNSGNGTDMRVFGPGNLSSPGSFLCYSGSLSNGLFPSGDIILNLDMGSCPVTTGQTYVLELNLPSTNDQIYGSATDISLPWGVGSGAVTDVVKSPALCIGETNTDFCSSFSGGGAVSSNISSFSSTTPAVEAISVATSTSFVIGAAGNVAPSDWNSNTVLYLRWQQQTGMGLRGNSLTATNGSATLPITASTTFNLSTTTNIQNTGIYQGYAAIQKPLFDVFGFSFFTQTIAAITWQFEVSTSTPIEQQRVKFQIESTGLGAGIATTTGTTTGPFANTNIDCSFLTGFGFSDCMNLLFVPTSSDIQSFYDTLSTGIINKVPWGYATIFVTDFTDSATSTLPSLTINLSDTGLVAGVNRSIDLTPWGDMLGSGTMLSDAQSPKDGQTIRQIVEPLWQDFVYLMLFMAIALRLLRFERTNK